MRKKSEKLSSTYCVYCGATFPIDNEAGDKVTQHINTCEKHPLFAAKKEIAKLQADHKAELERIVSLMNKRSTGYGVFPEWALSDKEYQALKASVQAKPEGDKQWVKNLTS